MMHLRSLLTLALYDYMNRRGQKTEKWKEKMCVHNAGEM